MSAPIQYLGRGTNGVIQRLPWARKITPSIVTITRPTISGTIAPGNTLTAVDGTYSPDGWRHVSWNWRQRDLVGNIVAEGTGPTFTLSNGTPDFASAHFDAAHFSTSAGASDGDLKVTQTVSYAGATHTADSDIEAITDGSGADVAPAFTSTPRLSASSAVVGAVLTATDATATGIPAPTVTRKYFRDGAEISGATGATYTTTAAGSYTMRNYAANGVSPDAISALSSPVTISTSSTVWRTVDTVDELRAAMIAAPAGAIIEVTPGIKYGVISFGTTAYTKSPPITIRAQDQANQPDFRGYQVTAARPETDPATYAVIFNFSNWNGFILEHLTFTNTKRDWRNGPGETEDRGFTAADAGRGSWGPFATLFDNTANITVRDCLFRGFAGSIYFRGCNGWLFEYNTFEHWTIDACRLYRRAQNGIFRNNRFGRTGAYPFNTSTSSRPNLSWDQDYNRHIDLLQFATDDGDNTNNVLIENNHFEMTIGGSNAHGCFMKSEHVFRDRGPFETDAVINNFTVRNNYFSGTNPQTIGILGVQNSTISGNLIRAGSQYDFTQGNTNPNDYNPEIWVHAPDDGSTGPMAARNVTISNNVFPCRKGLTSVRYGAGGADGRSGRVVVENLTITGTVGTTGRNPTAVPTGWESTDVAQGRTGRRVNGAFVDTTRPV